MNSRKSIHMGMAMMTLLLALPGMSHGQKLSVAGDPMPAFRFRKVVMNGDGHVLRDHFVGKPLLIELWGYR